MTNFPDLPESEGAPRMQDFQFESIESHGVGHSRRGMSSTVCLTLFSSPKSLLLAQSISYLLEAESAFSPLNIFCLKIFQLRSEEFDIYFFPFNLEVYTFVFHVVIFGRINGKSGGIRENTN